MGDERDNSAGKARPTPDPAQPEDLVGEVIDGRYRLKRYLSQGGMGTVYEAEHITIQKPIAVKLLHPSMAQIPELVRRFEREAFAIGRIDHPNCIRVSDFGSLEDGSLFLVMEFLDGVSLADCIDEGGAIALPRAMRIMRHILRGLAHVHKAGIVHRDVKPENIMLVEQDGDRDFAKLLDFGIAKLVGEAKREGDMNLTQAGIAFGTPTYMSPEQALGDSVDARSDLYQVSVVFHEMLAGRTPFRSDDKIELMAMHASRPPPPVNEHNPAAEVPPAVQALLDRGLAKRSAERWASADEYLAALDAAFGALGLTPPPRLDTPMIGMDSAEVSSAIERARDASVSRQHLTLPASESTVPPTRAGTAASPGQSRTPLFIVLGLAALALAVIGIWAAARDDGGGDRSASLADADLDPRSPIARDAAKALERGQPGEALAMLTAKGVDLSTDADALLLLGHANAAKNRPKATLVAYRNAIALKPEFAEDEAMRANLSVLLGDKEVFQDTARMLLLELGDESIKALIAKRAVTENDGEWRHLALQLAEELSLVDTLDLRRLYELDLEEGTRCNYRQDAVAKLRAIGDPAAIPALQKARNRKGTRGRWRGRFVNGCLREDAEKAIQYLETLAGERKAP